jgi:hypothetical protein
VRNKDRLARRQANNEPLMPAASEVVRQNARYLAFPFNLDITRPRFECARDFTVVTGRNSFVSSQLPRATSGCPDQDK